MHVQNCLPVPMLKTERTLHEYDPGSCHSVPLVLHAAELYAGYLGLQVCSNIRNECISTSVLPTVESANVLDAVQRLVMLFAT